MREVHKKQRGLGDRGMAKWRNLGTEGVKEKSLGSVSERGLLAHLNSLITKV